MQQVKTNFGFWAKPPTTAAGNDGFFDGVGNPNPEEVERKTLPTQENRFPHETGPVTDMEALNLTLGD